MKHTRSHYRAIQEWAREVNKPRMLWQTSIIVPGTVLNGIVIPPSIKSTGKRHLY